MDALKKNSNMKNEFESFKTQKPEIGVRLDQGK